MSRHLSYLLLCIALVPSLCRAATYSYTEVIQDPFSSGGGDHPRDYYESVFEVLPDVTGFNGFEYVRVHAVDLPLLAVEDYSMSLMFWIYVPPPNEYMEATLMNSHRNAETDKASVLSRFSTVFRMPTNATDVIPALWLHADEPRIRFSLKGYYVVDDEVVTDSKTVLSYGKWHHVAVTMTETRMSLYIDGQLDSETFRERSHFHSILRNDGPLYVGWDEWSKRGFSGLLAHFRAYNYAVTTTDIAHDMVRSRPRVDSVARDTAEAAAVKRSVVLSELSLEGTPLSSGTVDDYEAHLFTAAASSGSGDSGNSGSGRGSSGLSGVSGVSGSSGRGLGGGVSEAAVANILRAASGHDADGCYLAGLAHLLGSTEQTPIDTARATVYLECAAAQLHPRALFWLGFVHSHGLVSEPSEDAMLFAYNLGVAAGSDACRLALAARSNRNLQALIGVVVPESHIGIAPQFDPLYGRGVSTAALTSAEADAAAESQESRFLGFFGQATARVPEYFTPYWGNISLRLEADGANTPLVAGDYNSVRGALLPRAVPRGRASRGTSHAPSLYAESEHSPYCHLAAMHYAFDATQAEKGNRDVVADVFGNNSVSSVDAMGRIIDNVWRAFYSEIRLSDSVLSSRPHEWQVTAEHAVALYEAAAEAGDVEAALALGLHFYEVGEMERAFAMFTLAAEAGELTALTQKGAMLVKGEGVARDIEAGRAALSTANEAGDDLAARLLGDTYFYADPPDYRKALKLYKRSVELGGDPHAYARVGSIYIDGVGTAVNEVDGVYYLEEAAVGGDILANSRLGRYLLRGGELGSCVSAVWYLRFAAVSGMGNSSVGLHRMLRFGYHGSVDGSHIAGYLAYAAAAEMGSESAARNAAWLLDAKFSDEDVEQLWPPARLAEALSALDERERKEKEAAAEESGDEGAGDSVASDDGDSRMPRSTDVVDARKRALAVGQLRYQTAHALYYESYKELDKTDRFVPLRLGDFYYYGLGVSRDITTSYKWYAVAALSPFGSAQALFNLGYMWMSNETATNNETLSRMAFTLAPLQDADAYLASVLALTYLELRTAASYFNISVNSWDGALLIAANILLFLLAVTRLYLVGERDGRDDEGGLLGRGNGAGNGAGNAPANGHPPPPGNVGDGNANGNADGNAVGNNRENEHPHAD